jgi:hypothetical protein
MDLAGARHAGAWRCPQPSDQRQDVGEHLSPLGPASRNPEGSGSCSGRSGIEELIELDMATLLLHRDNRIAQLDQVLLLHVDQLLTHLLGFLFRRKRDFHEIGHLRLGFIRELVAVSGNGPR